MTLKYEIDKAAFDKLAEPKQGLYKPDGDGYILQVSGVVSKTKHDEFRNTNIELTNKLKTFDKVDLSKWDHMVQTEQKLNDKKLIDSGDIDSLIAQKVGVITADFQTKLDNADQKLNTLTENHNSTVSKYEIQGAATKAFAAHSIRAQAQEAIMSQIKNKFIIKEGAAVAMDGDKIIAGKDGNLTISEFVSSQPDFMKEPSSGGLGSESNTNTNTNDDKSSTDKIKSGLATMMK